MSTSRFLAGFNERFANSLNSRSNCLKSRSTRRESQAETSETIGLIPSSIRFIEIAEIETRIEAKETEVKKRKEELCQQFDAIQNRFPNDNAVLTWEAGFYRTLNEPRERMCRKSVAAQRKAQEKGDFPFEEWNFYYFDNYDVVLNSVKYFKLKSELTTKFEPETVKEIFERTPLLDPKAALKHDLEKFVRRADDTGQSSRVVQQWSRNLLEALEAKIGKKGLYTEKQGWLKVQVVLDKIFEASTSLANSNDQIREKFSVGSVTEILLVSTLPTRSLD